MRKLLKVCRNRNMNVNPEKLQLDREEVYGGTKIKGARQKGDRKTTVYMSPSEEKLRTFLDIKTPGSKTEVQRIAGMAAQMKKFVPGLMMTFPAIQKMTAHNIPFKWTRKKEGSLETSSEVFPTGCLKKAVRLHRCGSNARYVLYPGPEKRRIRC